MSAPIWGLPPDLEVLPGEDVFINAPSVWHLPQDVWSAIWADYRGQGERIAILDTGFSAHNDLPTPVATRSFISGESVDDRNAHGTHCAGTALGRNGIGVAPDAQLLVGKVLSNRGSGSSTGIAAGVEWAIDQGATIISMSLGGGSAHEPTRRALQRANDNGILVCASAGNSGQRPPSNTIGYPGRHLESYCSGSMDQQGRISSFSSAGREMDGVTPGSQIVSTSNTSPSGYKTMSGTCIAEGSYVYGPAGPRKIEAIQPGEVVYAWKDGQMVERVVYQNHYRGTADTVVLNANGRDVRLTPTHQVMVFDSKERDFAWVEAQHIEAHQKALLPRKFDNQINPYLDRLLDDDFCWLLGFFAGDGWISYTTGGMRNCFATGDKAHVINEVKRIYQKTTGKSLKSNNSGTWHYDDSTMTAMVIECLGFHEPAKSKNFPLWLWNLSQSKQRSFYSGYLAADGSRKREADKTTAFECVSSDLIRRIAVLHDYWGAKHGRCRSRVREIQAPNSLRKTPCRTFQLTANSESQLNGNWKFMQTKSRSGDEVAAGYGVDVSRFAASGVRIIDDVQNVAVYDLTVPDADCFVTQGLITHNSMSCPFAVGLFAVVRSGMASAGLPRLGGIDDWRPWLQQFFIDQGLVGHDSIWGWGIPDYNKIVAYLAQDEIKWV